MEQVILVDPQDTQIGTMEKMEAHRTGQLHRAFSIFIFNRHGELMLQRRALDKYHSAGLWSNTCCSHPRPGETILCAAHRRLQEEMGFDCQLDIKFNFIYKSHYDNGMIEHELDYVLFGNYDLDPDADANEVIDWKFMPSADIKSDVEKAPHHYTSWFRIVYDQVLKIQ